MNDSSYVGGYQTNASINPFNYPIYFELIQSFNSSAGGFDSLVSEVSQVKGNFSDPTLLGSFLNNHDNPRFESYTSDMAVRLRFAWYEDSFVLQLIQNAHAYAMVGDGIPYVYCES